jgi:hypothetical protein
MPMWVEGDHAMLMPVKRKTSAAYEFYAYQISGTAISAAEQAMILFKTHSSASSWTSRRRTFAAERDRVAYGVRAQSANIMRMLILALVILQLVLVGLMLLTGRVEIGGPIIGGVLLIGFGAAQFGR